MKEKIDYLMSRGYNYPQGWFIENPKRTIAMYFEELSKENKSIYGANSMVVKDQIISMSKLYYKKYGTFMEDDLRSDRRSTIQRVIDLNRMSKENEC